MPPENQSSHFASSLRLIFNFDENLPVSFLEIAFWSMAAFTVYTYVGYPLLLAIVAKLARRRVRAAGAAPSSVSILLAAHNEEPVIVRRLKELTQILASFEGRGEVLVVSDGSTDRTVELASAFADASVRVISLEERVGKAAALSLAAEAATGEILVFADARQSWAPDALHLLLENFGDPRVGAVSGDLVVESAPGVLAGVGLYWRYEKWLRRLESDVSSVVGVSGSISAVRRSLFAPIPAGTVLDDVYWPLGVVMRGFRVIHDFRAHAYDRLPAEVHNEFRRKVRTLSGNYQLLTRRSAALLPWRNPIWFQFLSHKIFRLFVPWALIGLLVLSAILTGPLFQTLFWLQVAFYGAGLVGLRDWSAFRPRLASAAASFLVLNAAAFLALIVWTTGRSTRSWRKVAYT